MKKILVVLLIINIFFLVNLNIVNGNSDNFHKNKFLDYNCYNTEINKLILKDKWKDKYKVILETKYSLDGKRYIYGGIPKGKKEVELVVDGEIIGNYKYIYSYGFAEFGSSYYFIEIVDGKQLLYINGKLIGTYFSIKEVTLGYGNDNFLIKILNKNGLYKVISNKGKSKEYKYIDFLMFNKKGDKFFFTATNGNGKYIYVKDGVESIKYKSIYPIFYGNDFIYLYNINGEKWFYNINGVDSKGYTSILELLKENSIKKYNFLIRDTYNLYFYGNGKKSTTFLNVYDLYQFDDSILFVGDNKKYLCEREKNKEKFNIKSKNIFFKNLILSKKELEKTKKGKNNKDKFNKLVPKMQNKKLIEIYNKLEKIDLNNSKFKKHKNILQYLKAKIGLEIYKRDLVEK